MHERKFCRQAQKPQTIFLDEELMKTKFEACAPRFLFASSHPYFGKSLPKDYILPKTSPYITPFKELIYVYIIAHIVYVLPTYAIQSLFQNGDQL